MSRDRRSSSYACAAAVFTLFIVSASWAQTPGPLKAITDVRGIEVGQYPSTDATSGGGTGTTVVVSRGGAVGGVSQRGGAPGTRETDLLRPENLVEKVNAVVLSGGSAYGLAAADGVMLCLEAQGIGFPVGPGQVVPIVPSAILFDPGRCAPFSSRPNAAFGLAACHAASGGPVQQGNVGAGAGDTIFVMATGTDPRDATTLVNGIGSGAADTLSRAVVHAILAAQSIHVGSCDVKSYCEQFPNNCAK